MKRGMMEKEKKFSWNFFWKGNRVCGCLRR